MPSAGCAAPAPAQLEAVGIGQHHVEQHGIGRSSASARSPSAPVKACPALPSLRARTAPPSRQFASSSTISTSGLAGMRRCGARASCSHTLQNCRNSRRAVLSPASSTKAFNEARHGHADALDEDRPKGRRPAGHRPRLPSARLLAHARGQQLQWPTRPAGRRSLNCAGERLAAGACHCLSELSAATTDAATLRREVKRCMAAGWREMQANAAGHADQLQPRMPQPAVNPTSFRSRMTNPFVPTASPSCLRRAAGLLSPVAAAAVMPAHQRTRHRNRGPDHECQQRRAAGRQTAWRPGQHPLDHARAVVAGGTSQTVNCAGGGIGGVHGQRRQRGQRHRRPARVGEVWRDLHQLQGAPPGNTLNGSATLTVVTASAGTAQVFRDAEPADRAAAAAPSRSTAARRWRDRGRQRRRRDRHHHRWTRRRSW